MFCHLGHFFFRLGASVTLRGGALGVPRGGVTLLLHCDAVRGGGAEREQWRTLHSPADFNLSLCYPQSNWAPLVLVPEWMGLCTS